MACSICKSPLVSQVNAMLDAGAAYSEVERTLRASGLTITRQTISMHARGCSKPVLAPALAVARSPQARQDFATLVQQRTQELLEAGDLQVTVRDGLAATAIIDKRDEKAKDREFVLNLARLISGAGQGAPVTIIDGGEYEVLDEGSEEDALLAPLALREA